jgi:hypothetical protein
VIRSSRPDRFPWIDLSPDHLITTCD